MNIKLNIPETLKEVTLSQYQKWVKIIDEEELSSFFQQKMIEIFCSSDLKAILQMKVKDVDEVTTHIDNLFKEKPVFVPTLMLAESISTTPVESTLRGICPLERRKATWFADASCNWTFKSPELRVS